MSHHKRSKTYSSDEEERGTNFGKRRKIASVEGVEKRLETILYKVGEKNALSIETNLESVCAILEADLPRFKKQILDIMVLCSYQLPENCTIYTTLTGLLNKRNSECGGDFVDMLMSELKYLIITNQFDYARNLIRFLSDLCNCKVVSTFSLIALFNSFISVTKEENIPQTRKDWYVYATLSALPWVGRILSVEFPEEFSTVFLKIKMYMIQRNKDHHDFLRVWSNDDPHPQEEYLDCLYIQICKLMDDNWNENFILRPYLAFDMKQAFTHNIPSFVVPPHVENKSIYPCPQVVFRIFDYTDCPDNLTVPGNHSIERWLIEDGIRAVISTHVKDRKDVASRLQAVFDPKKIPLNYVLVECIFGDMFRLPLPPNHLVFYTSLFIELCKLQPAKMPQVLALATDMLFERLDTMNITCVDRFVNWFSHHLSNFQFTWSWDEWTGCLDDDLALPRPKFIKEVLEKCMRLAYHKKIVDMMPAKYEVLFPVEPKFKFKYQIVPGSSKQDHMGITTSQRIISSIQNKCSDEDMIALLEEIVPSTNLNGASVENCDVQRIELFTHSLLYLAKKSFSHSFSGLSKFHKVFKWITAEDSNKKPVILQVVKDAWQRHNQMVVVLVEKMLRLQIVDCVSVVQWIFSNEMAADFTRLYVWEIMHSTIRRMASHLQRYENEFSEMKKNSQLKNNDENQNESDNLLGMYNAYAPNNDDLELVSTQIENAKEQQKKLFVAIFQRFLMILSDHFAKCDENRSSYDNPWYKNTIDRLKEMFLLHGSTVKKYESTLKLVLFTDKVDPRIMSVYYQYLSVK